MPPGEQTLGPLRTQKLPADKKTQDLPSEEGGQPAVGPAAELTPELALNLKKTRNILGIVKTT